MTCRAVASGKHDGSPRIVEVPLAEGQGQEKVSLMPGKGAGGKGRGRGEKWHSAANGVLLGKKITDWACFGVQKAHRRAKK